jgi:hypothetical protein
MSIRLTKSAFQQWLEEHRTEVIGQRGKSKHCAIAEYLKAKGAVVPNVTRSCITYEYRPWYGIKREVVLAPPSWAREFINRFDGQEADVIGAHAVKLLETC